MKKILSLLILLFACNGIIQAQSTSSGPIRELLAHMPAQNQSALQENLQQMAAMGTDGLTSLALMVSSRSGGADSAVRYALGSFSYAATQPGKDDWRSMSVKAYCNALGKIAGREAKAFLIRQLQITGEDDAVSTLQGFLQDPELDGPAIRALEQINTAASNQALLNALPSASDSLRTSLIEALGRNRYSKAVSAITPSANSENQKLRKVALYALANIADPRSAKTLSRAAKKNKFTFDNGNATSSYLHYIRQLAENGHAVQAEKEAARLLKKTKNEIHTHHAATVLLAIAKEKQPFTLSRDEKKEGYKILFDGTSMDHWQGNLKDYTIEDGNIVIHAGKQGGHGNLYTKNEYSDFSFKFEFKLTPGANNGLGIRAPLEGDAAYQGMEIQVLDNTAPIYKDLHVYQFHGSVYGVIPAKKGSLKPVGEWNKEEVIAKGSHIKVILNGTVILDGDIAEASKNGTLDHKNHPGLKRTQGHIGFLGHGSTVRFRYIRVKDLSGR